MGNSIKYSRKKFDVSALIKKVIYGKIKEKGSFNELIELKGAFYNLWIRQKSGS